MEHPKTKSNKSSRDHKEETFDEKKERYETPFSEYNYMMDLVKHLGLPACDLDAMASRSNKKCKEYLSVSYDSVNNDYLIRGKKIPKSVFIQAPHKLYNKVLPQIESQWKKYGFCVVALIPSRNERTNYWKELVEPNRFECVKDGHIFYFPLTLRIIFEIDGEQATSQKGEVMHDPNGYKLVIWIPKKKLKGFKKNIQKFYQWYYLQPLIEKAKKRDQKK